MTVPVPLTIDDLSPAMRDGLRILAKLEPVDVVRLGTLAGLQRRGLVDAERRLTPQGWALLAPPVDDVDGEADLESP